MDAARDESKQLEGKGATQFVGRVLRSTELGWLVQGRDSRYIARAATSCLLVPVPDDRVLVVSAGAECWILSILDRQANSESLIQAEGDLTFRSTSGSIGLDSHKEVGISSRSEISLRSPKLSVASRLAELMTGKLSWIGSRAEVQFDGARFIGRLFDSVVERFSRKARWSYRTVEEVDQVRSNHIDYRADSNMSLQARNVLAKARDLAKLDGNQIHLG